MNNFSKLVLGAVMAGMVSTAVVNAEEGTTPGAAEQPKAEKQHHHKMKGKKACGKCGAEKAKKEEKKEEAPKAEGTDTK